MKHTKIVTFLDKILGSHKEYTNLEFYYKCPLCNRADNKKKLAIKLDENSKDANGDSLFGNWHCWRDNSHKGKNLFQLLKRINVQQDKYQELKKILGNKNSLQNFDEYVKNVITPINTKTKKVHGLPKEFISLKNNIDNPHYKNAYRYVTKDRHLTDNDIIKYNIGYCDSGKYAGYIVVPSYDSDMNINYFATRNFYKSAFKHKNPPFRKNVIFNELFINWNKPIILCEGVFDAMTIKRNAIPILGKYIQPNLKFKILKNCVRDVYIALDNDAVKDSINIIQDFLKNDINIYFVELEKKDPNEIGFKDIWNEIKNSKKINFKDLIRMKISVK